MHGRLYLSAVAVVMLATVATAVSSSDHDNISIHTKLVREGPDNWLLSVNGPVIIIRPKIISNDPHRNTVQLPVNDKSSNNQYQLFIKNNLLYAKQDQMETGRQISTSITKRLGGDDVPFSVESISDDYPVVAIKSLKIGTDGKFIAMIVTFKSLENHVVSYYSKDGFHSATVLPPLNGPRLQQLADEQNVPRLLVLEKQLRGVVNLFLTDLTADTQVVPITATLPNNVASILHIGPHVINQETLGRYFQLTTENGDVYVVDCNDGGTKFAQDASLAKTIDALIIELPEAKMWTQDTDKLDEHGEEIQTAGFVMRYIRRWRKHIHQLCGLPRYLLASLEIAGIHFSTDTTAKTTQRLHRGSFGFEKLLVFLTEDGKIFGIDSHTGDVIWRRHLLHAGATKLIAIRHLFIKYPPIIAVIFTLKTSTTVYQMNALTGEDLTLEGFQSQVKFSQKITQVLPLPFIEPSEKLHCFAMVAGSGQIFVYPETNDTLRLIGEHKNYIHFHVVDKEKNSLTGFHVKVDKNGMIRSEISWNFIFPLGEIFFGLASRPDHDKVASLGHVKSDRSVLYKYLNPHMIAFLSTNAQRNSLNVYILDTVSGSLIHHGSHVAGTVDTQRYPVHIVQAENWIMYHYWNTGNQQAADQAIPLGWTATVMELYESDMPNTRYERKTDTSFASFQPYVAIQSYSFPGEGLTAAKVATTRNGVSLKDLIYASDESVISLSRRFLDALRPTGPLSSEDKEAGTMPYSPALPYDPRSILSKHWPVRGIRTILTSPTKLESTSMVLAYGQDIFWVKVTPSGAFDMLSEQFAKSALLATCLGLFVASMIARAFLANRQLSAQWQ